MSSSSAASTTAERFFLSPMADLAFSVMECEEIGELCLDTLSESMHTTSSSNPSSLVASTVLRVEPPSSVFTRARKVFFVASSAPNAPSETLSRSRALFEPTMTIFVFLEDVNARRDSSLSMVSSSEEVAHLGS